MLDPQNKIKYKSNFYLFYFCWISYFFHWNKNNLFWKVHLSGEDFFDSTIFRFVHQNLFPKVLHFYIFDRHLEGNPINFDNALWNYLFLFFVNDLNILPAVEEH